MMNETPEIQFWYEVVVSSPSALPLLASVSVFVWLGDDCVSEVAFPFTKYHGYFQDQGHGYTKNSVTLPLEKITTGVYRMTLELSFQGTEKALPVAGAVEVFLHEGGLPSCSPLSFWFEDVLRRLRVKRFLNPKSWLMNKN